MMIIINLCEHMTLRAAVPPDETMRAEHIEKHSKIPRNDLVPKSLISQPSTQVALFSESPTP
jgi:hypothetical protein